MISFTLLGKILSIKDKVVTDLQTGLSVKNIILTITDPDILNALEGFAEEMFPKVAPELRVAAAIASSFDTNGVKFAQNALNRLVVPAPNLTVDGHVGPLTKKAVADLQEQLGLRVDSFFGDKTLAAALYLLNKMDSDTLITPVVQPAALPVPA